MRVHDLQKLRLAARSLVEWRTSPNSPDYDYVLKYIANLHGHPKARLLASRKDILECDDEGIVMLYLMEHIGYSPTNPAGEEARPMMAVDRIVADRFRRLATLHESATSVCWTTEGERTRLEYAILNAIADSDETVSILGHEAILALVIPLTVGVQHALAREMLARCKLSTRTRFQQKILRMTWGGIGAVVLPLYVLLLGYIASAIGEERFINFILGPLLTGFIACIFLPFPIIVLLNTILETVQDLLTGENPLNPISKTKTLKALASLVGNRPGVISTLAVEQYEALWFSLALRNTTVVRRSVVREALRLLREPGIREHRRGMIMEWLATVQVAPNIS